MVLESVFLAGVCPLGSSRRRAWRVDDPSSLRQAYFAAAYVLREIIFPPLKSLFENIVIYRAPMCPAASLGYLPSLTRSLLDRVPQGPARHLDRRRQGSLLRLHALCRDRRSRTCWRDPPNPDPSVGVRAVPFLASFLLLLTDDFGLIAATQPTCS